MFEQLQLITADSILGLMAAFRADPEARKVDLGVGVYRDDRGDTPGARGGAHRRSRTHCRSRPPRPTSDPPATRASTPRWRSWSSAPRTRCSPPGG